MLFAVDDVFESEDGVAGLVVALVAKRRSSQHGAHNYLFFLYWLVLY
jgi:hypothetical protein